MSAYGALAAWYDALTRDVDYAAFADFYEQCFQQGRGACHTLLDFCCGTGTLTRLMAARGYEMIATDGSPDMLRREAVCDQPSHAGGGTGAGGHPNAAAEARRPARIVPGAGV